MVEVTKELMLTQSREFLPMRKKEPPHSVHGNLKPRGQQLAMIVLSVWALPLAKLSAAVASLDQRREKRPCPWVGGAASAASSSENTSS